MLKLFFFCLLFVFCFAKDTCSKHSDAGDSCKVSVYDLRATQFVVGMEEIKCKKSRFESMSSSQLKDYLKKKPIPAFVAPDENFYITDHHHLSRALIDANIDDDDKVVYLNIQNNLYKLPSMDSFWKTMIENSSVWLYDETGKQPIDPSFIPLISNLIDDPYRSLAWMVRNGGGYGKLPIPFQDFYWANFFRSRLPLNPSLNAKKTVTAWDWCTVRPYSEIGNCTPNVTKALDRVLPDALKLSKSPEAKNLPGYGQGEIDPPNCG